MLNITKRYKQVPFMVFWGGLTLGGFTMFTILCFRLLTGGGETGVWVLIVIAKELVSLPAHLLFHTKTVIEPSASTFRGDALLLMVNTCIGALVGAAIAGMVRFSRRNNDEK